MKKNRFLMLMVATIIGLFSVAYAETIAAVPQEETGTTVKTTEPVMIAQTQPAPAPVAVQAAVTAPAALPAPPAAPQVLPRKGDLLSWWNGGNQAVPKGKEFTIVDVRTGKSFKAVRTYGHNHADIETLTNADTLKMKEIWGGSWTWERRAVVVIIDGKTIAASCAGLPHAGLDKAPAESTVTSRSGGFGRGVNLDKIKNNGMDGVVDLHLLNSKTHCTNKVDPRHQAMIRVAAGQ